MATAWPLTVSGSIATTLLATRYWPLGGDVSPLRTTEAPTQVMLRGAYTLDQMWVYLSTNSRTDTITFGSRKNTAAGGMGLSIATTLTGAFEDLSGSDSLVDGDVANYQATPGAGAGTITLRSIVSRCTSASNEQLLITSGSEPEGSLISHNMSTGGRVHTADPESIAQLTLYDSVTFSKLRFVCSANTMSAATPVTLYINGSPGTQTVSVTASTTGAFEDTTHSDSIVADDEIHYEMDATGSLIGGSITPTIFQMKANTTAGRFIGGWHNAQAFNVTTYSPIDGRWFSPNATEAASQTVARVDATYSDLDIFFYDNTLNNTTVVTFRVDGVDTDLTVSAGAAASGHFHDSTHTVDVVAADLLALKVDTTASGSGSIFVANTLLMTGLGAAETVQPFRSLMGVGV